MTKVEGSSSVDEHGYDPETKTMRVKYVSGPTYYDHANVDASKYQGFLNAPSKGQYLHTHIRGAKDKDGKTLHPSTKVVPSGLGV